MHPGAPSQYMVVTTGSAQTAVYPPHVHCAKVDKTGNGTTSIDLNHSHPVVGGIAQATPDGHMHGLTNAPCPHDVNRRWAGCTGCTKR